MEKRAKKTDNTKQIEKATLREIAQAMHINLGTRWPDRFGVALRKGAVKSIKRPIRTLSLFSGAGGLDIGFHDGGFSVQTMIEVNEGFVGTLKANSGDGRYLGESNPICEDIQDFDPPKDMKVDFIIGGPPCQPFSAAARRAAGVKGTSDERGALFEDYVRIVKKLQPRGFLFENVLGLTGAENGNAWKKISASFAKAGYRVFYRVLDAADYGVPQHRKRLFIVGTRGKNYRFPRPICGPDSPDQYPYMTAGQALEGVSINRNEHIRVNGKYGGLLNQIPPGLNYSFYTEKMHHPNPIFAWRSKFFDFLYKADPMAPIRTLTARGGQYSGPFHWRNRRFTTAELKRLQTIPDDYEITGRREAAREQIGNSVPPQVARMLALTILNQLFGVDLPFELPLLDENQSLVSKKRKNIQGPLYRQKAISAITKLKRSHTPKRVYGRRYTAALTNAFGWDTQSRVNPNLYVQFAPSQDEWRFMVSSDPQRSDPAFSVIITPKSGSTWSVGVPRVILSGSELTREMFTGAWKAFESELALRNIKADLVQLCGYYTYPPSFDCRMSFEMNKGISMQWKAVRTVVNGVGVGKILPATKLSKLWGIPKGQVLTNAIYLKKLGYEVRNHNTNPNIPKDQFLIPYAFPTLRPASVQLHKSLLAERVKK